MNRRLTAASIALIAGILVSGCKSRKSRDSHQPAPLEKVTETAKNVTTKASMGTFSFSGTTGKDSFSINQIKSNKNVSASDLSIESLDVRIERFEDTFNHYPLVVLKKSEQAIYSEYRLCQSQCEEGVSVKDSFTIFNTGHISDYNKEVSLSVRACVDKTQTAGSSGNCGSWVSYRDMQKKPLFLKYQPDSQLTLLLTQEEQIRDEIRNTGIKLSEALTSNASSGLQLAGEDESITSLRELGGHLTGEGLVSRASSYSSRPRNSTSVDGCFTKEHHEKLSKEEKCRLSQYIGSGAAFIFHPPTKFYWEADMLCDGTLACTPQYGCANISKVKKYYQNPGEQCLPRDAKMALQVGGSVLLVGGLIGVAGAAVGYKSISDSAQNATRNRGLAIAGGAVALTAIAVGIWNLVESNSYALSGSEQNSSASLISEALKVTETLGHQLHVQSEKISAHLGSHSSGN